MTTPTAEPAASHGGMRRAPITHRTYARVGLLGNPSDQYGGRTIAFSLENFYAEVTLAPNPDSAASPAVRILPHPVYDSSEYSCLDELVARTTTQGLYGGVRVLTATCKRFTQYCAQHNIHLPTSCGGCGFTLSYDTNVPRQTGLAGSSAIIYSALKCLMEWYSTPLPPAVRPPLVLAVEAEELGVAAGLQDRVVQVYGGAVHMDFGASRSGGNEEGAGGPLVTHGSAAGTAYRRLPVGLLPLRLLWLMYSDNPSESGKVHSGVRARWLAGDPEVRALMSQVAECADEGMRLLLGWQLQEVQDEQEGEQREQQQQQGPEQGQQSIGEEQQHSSACADGWSPGRLRRLAELMNTNFNLRRALFGDAVLGARNLRMVELARSFGAGVNFSGSGGAVVVLCGRGEGQAAALRRAAAAEGFATERVRLGPELEELPVAC